MSPDGDAVRAALEAVRLDPLGDPTPIARGWESSIWRCDTDSGPVAVRVYGSGLDPDRAAREAVTMRLLEQARYPAPLVIHFEIDPRYLGTPFLVMDHLPGGTLWESGRDEESIGHETAELLGLLHEIDPGHFGEVPADPLGWIDQADLRVAAEFPGFVPVLRWIADHRGDVDQRCTPAHLDFHPGNILLDEDGAPWVIDWTSFRLTDPRLDLAWTLLLGEMYGTGEFTGALIERYAEVVDQPRDLGFFQVVAAVRRLTDVLYFLGPEGANTVQDRDAVMEDARRLQVARDWIEQETGLLQPEVEALLDSVKPGAFD